MPTYQPAVATTPHRNRDRVGYDRATVHAILDEAWFCHLAFVVDGRPASLPLMHARLGEDIYVHGSTGSGASLRTAAANSFNSSNLPAAL